MGLALLVSVDFHVPLLWKVYPGNQHDSITFAQALQELTQRYQALARDCQSITLIFDKGNNSATNQEILDASRFPFCWFAGTDPLSPICWPFPVEKFQKLKDARLQTNSRLAPHAPGLGAGTHPGDHLQSGAATQADSRYRAASSRKNGGP